MGERQRKMKGGGKAKKPWSLSPSVMAHSLPCVRLLSAPARESERERGRRKKGKRERKREHGSASSRSAEMVVEGGSLSSWTDRLSVATPFPPPSKLFLSSSARTTTNPPICG